MTYRRAGGDALKTRSSPVAIMISPKGMGRKKTGMPSPTITHPITNLILVSNNFKIKKNCSTNPGLLNPYLITPVRPVSETPGP